MNNQYYLIRHGRALDNNQHKTQTHAKFMGQNDIILSPEGLNEALELRKLIQNGHYTFDVAYSSPLKRAHHTALIALNHAKIEHNNSHNNQQYTLKGRIHNKETNPIPILLDDRLKERHFGDLTGEHKDEYKQLFPHYAKLEEETQEKITKSFSICPKGGETFNCLEERVLSFIHEAERTYKNKKIVIFSHNGVQRIERGFFENLSEEKTLHIHNKHCEIYHYS